MLSISCTGGWKLIRNSCQLWSPTRFCAWPFIVLLYITDLPENIQSQIRLFSDVTAIYITINNPSDLYTLQQDLDTLQTWESLWYMDFNPSKCQVLHISKSRHPAQHIYMLHWQALEAMNHAKYLGVDISKDLSWNTHINRISTRANRRLGFLKRNIKTKNTAIRTAAYQTQVRPQVEYASTVWSPSTQTYINKIEMVQRRALRWVNSNYSTYTSVSSMTDSLGWRSFEDRRADARLILFYKIVHNLGAVTLPQYINRPVKMTRHMHPPPFRPDTSYSQLLQIFILSVGHCSVKSTSPSYPHHHIITILPDR